MMAPPDHFPDDIHCNLFGSKSQVGFQRESQQEGEQHDGERIVQQSFAPDQRTQVRRKVQMREYLLECLAVGGDQHGAG